MYIQRRLKVFQLNIIIYGTESAPWQAMCLLQCSQTEIGKHYKNNSMSMIYYMASKQLKDVDN